MTLAPNPPNAAPSGLARWPLRLRNTLAAPFVYGLIVPLLLLDLMVGLYQATGFRLWGLPRVRRGDFLVLDRHRLAYLTGLQKLNCLYCGYANGVIAYAREVAARTEQYWCPIKHQSEPRAPHARYADFVDYGDAEAFQAMRESLRARLRQES